MTKGLRLQQKRNRKKLERAKFYDPIWKRGMLQKPIFEGWRLKTDFKRIY